MSRRKDRRFMAHAIDLALWNYGETGDNPSVGCVLVNSYGAVVGQGVTAVGGRPHAEQIALDMAGEAARGATAYVTLEPCRERSTDEDACSKRLIDAGITRVVCAVPDIHPKGAGGFQVLADAGVDLFIGLKINEALPLYEEFFAKHS